MGFTEEVKNLAATVLELKNDIRTEEAVKHSLVMPFLTLLGYNVFNPKEVVPEYIADLGTKKGEKVDYAILHEGEPHIILEIKAPDAKLEDHFNQLYRYFNSLRKAKFAILTNGIFFQLFSDLDEPNILDKTPFLTIDLEDLKEPSIIELEKFHKKKYNKEIILSTANDLKYTTQIKEFINKQLKKPDEDFIRYILKNIYTGKLTSNVIERFEPLIIKSISLFINELLSDKLKIALEGVKKEELKDEIPEPTVENEEVSKKRTIITTEEELEAFVLIKLLLKDTVGKCHTINYKDTSSYFVVLLDNNIRNWICRIWLEDKARAIKFRDGQKFEIKTPDDIEKYKDILIQITMGLLKDNIESKIPPQKPPLDTTNWLTIEELIQKGSSGQKPIQLKLPDGNILTVNKWRDIIEKILLWLYDKKKLQTNHCPIPDYAEKNRFCINTSPLHPTGKTFKNVINVYDKIYGEANYSSENHLKNLIQILNKIKENSNGFKIIIKEEENDGIEEVI